MEAINSDAGLQFLATYNNVLAGSGFLPQQIPLRELSDPRYSPWESLALKLPSILKTGRIADAVMKCPVISTQELTTVEEARRAYVILTYVSHAYIWGSKYPAEVLPPQLSVPLLEVSSRLSLPPILTAAAANLWNFTSSSFSPSLSSITPLLSFTSTATESWFLMVGVAVEIQGRAVTSVIDSAVRAAITGNFMAIAVCLEKLATHIAEIITILARLPEKCDPGIFYHEVRPFYAGTKNMASVGLPRGVLYDEGDGQGFWKQLRGGSNGQSSLFPLIDAILGVQHGSVSKYQTTRADSDEDYHVDILQYMPGEHRAFRSDFRRIWDIQKIITAITDPRVSQAVTKAHQNAVSELSRFRTKHIQIVSRYIIVSSKKSPPAWATAEHRRHNLATMHQIEKQEGLMGTSGTQLMPFLKRARDDTLKTLQMNSAFQ